MKTKCKSSIRAPCQSFGGAVCAGVVLLMASSAEAQNLFVSDMASGNICEFTPSGVQSTFATGLGYPAGLAFNSAGDLFEADDASGNIYKFTPGGVRSTFFVQGTPGGVDPVVGMAFNNVGDLFATDFVFGNVYEYTPGGAQTTYTSGVNGPWGLAFQPVPEPSALGLLAVAATALLVRRRRDLPSDIQAHQRH